MYVVSYKCTNNFKSPHVRNSYLQLIKFLYKDFDRHCLFWITYLINAVLFLREQ